MTTILSLPNELLDEVIREFYHDPVRLAGIRSLNKRFYNLVPRPVFFQRLILRNQRKNLSSILYVTRNPEYADYVQEVVFDLRQHDQEPHECMKCPCPTWKTNKLSAGSYTCHDLFYEFTDESKGVVLRYLKKLTLRYPTKYILPESLTEDLSPVDSHGTCGDHLDTVKEYSYRMINHVQGVLLGLISWMKRCGHGLQDPATVASKFTSTETSATSPISLSLENYPVTQFNRLQGGTWWNRFFHIKTLHLSLSFGQTYHNEVRLLTPAAIESVWSRSWPTLFRILAQFKSLKKLHLSGPPVDWAQHYSTHMECMGSETIGWISKKHDIGPSVEEFILENLPIGLVELVHGLMSLHGPQLVKLKNCILWSTDLRPYTDAHAPWAHLFRFACEDLVTAASGGTPYGSLKVYGTSDVDGEDDEIEGDPSRFLFPVPDDRETLPPGNGHTSSWSKARLVRDTRAVDEYWRFQKQHSNWVSYFK
ncbi:hypothetical protein AJ80_02256 [Polytolypa hystricis UAMH7299]|uniref:F-box domain-containing protein n=1 Tax=Polytolypa hystricis (strain UAMH7299) TaxID=1447883 RepID=A0A2B7YR48_POLH7|nr:hypothetical protein AJ80_02256 [Polytolypa hystricis UAMH7299]